MEEVPNFCNNVKMEINEQNYLEYPITYSTIPEGVIIKEEPTSDEEDYGELTLVAYSPLPQGVIKDEPQTGVAYDEEDDQTFSNATPAGDGFLLIVPGSVISLANSARETAVGESSTACFSNHENGTKQGADRSQTGKRKRTTLKNMGTARREAGETTGTNQVVSSSSQQSHLKHLKQINNSSGFNAGKTGGERRTAADVVKDKSDTSSEEDECTRNDDKSEHSSLEDIDSSDEDVVQKKASQSKQNAAAKAIPKAQHLNETDRAYECGDCGRSYKYKFNLTHHLNVECGVEPHIPCSVCGTQFKTKVNLRKHLVKIHKIDRSQLEAFGIVQKIRPDNLPFKCDKCDKSYKRKQHLDAHLTHDCGLDPTFQCGQCEYKAKRKGNFRAHLVNVHNVDRSQLVNYGAGYVSRPVQPFKCEKCNRTYKTKGSLGQHLKYECGLDPSFACTQCDFKSKQKSGLKSHFRGVHGGVPSQLK